MDQTFTRLLEKHLPYVTAVEITPDAILRDLGLNSMQAVNLLLALEDAYRIVLPDELLSDEIFETAGSLWSAVAAVRTP
jgi:acyl carrier protein